MGEITFLTKLMILSLTLYVSIALHELGHFITFKINKISMRMLNITFVSFIFDGSKWTVTFNRNTAGVGGIAIPNLEVVADVEDFRKMQKGYANAILGGPLTSLLLVGLAILLLMAKGYLFIIGGSLLLVNIIMFLTCFIKADGVYGDFPAYQAYKEDDFFAALMMYQYAMFAVDYEHIRENNTYLRKLLLKELGPRVKNRQTDLLTVSTVSTFINEYLVEKVDEVPEWIQGYIDYYHDNYRMITSTHKAEANKQLLLHIAYYYKKIGSEDKAVDIYKNFIKKLPKSDVFHYWKIQSEQIIMEKDHSTYLLDKKNIKPGLAYGVFKKLEGFYHDELILNEMS